MVHDWIARTAKAVTVELDAFRAFECRAIFSAESLMDTSGKFSLALCTNVDERLLLLLEVT